MAEKNVILTENEGADTLYPATKIGQVQGGGDLFNSIKTKALGNAGQMLRVDAQGTNTEWVDPYDASTAVISTTVAPDDPNPVSGDAVYQALGETHTAGPNDLSGLDVVPGLYSIDISNAVFPSGSNFSMARKQFIVSAEDPEGGPGAAASNSLVAYEEFAINSDGEVTNTYDIYIYYTYEFINEGGNRTFWISLWMNGSEITVGAPLTNGVKVTRLLKYA